jgi:hypothetical protein
MVVQEFGWGRNSFNDYAFFMILKSFKVLWYDSLNQVCISNIKYKEDTCMIVSAPTRGGP